MVMIDFARKLYNHLSGCPLVYILFFSFIIHTLCSTHPGISVYLLYMYTYKVIRKNYLKTQEQHKKNVIELEDIQLQSEIVKTKLCVFEAELTERAKPLRREAERLREVRARVAELIAGDDALQRLMQAVGDCDNDTITLQNSDQQALDTINNELMISLLERVRSKNDEANSFVSAALDCGEHAESSESAAADKHSDYSSLADGDVMQDCRVKIVRVTNVYKVAYLKHYIKQKRLRRANKRALLKKKMESIKELLEDWQKTLNMVINSKLTILNIDHSIDLASQEAMGDYSKPCESSDSDSDIRNNDNLFFDDYRGNRYEQESAVSREYYDTQEFRDMMFPSSAVYMPTTSPDMTGLKSRHPLNMVSIVEETGSQLAIDEIAESNGTPDDDDGDDDDGDDCRDDVAI